MVSSSQPVAEQQLRSAGASVLVGQSAALQKLVARAMRFAPSTAPVLVMGESGTGKELVARLLHDHGRYPDGPLVPVNCGALSRELAESELFGHERGAFTGRGRAADGVVRGGVGRDAGARRDWGVAAGVAAQAAAGAGDGATAPGRRPGETAVDVRVVALTLARSAPRGRARAVPRRPLPPAVHFPAGAAAAARSARRRSAADRSLSGGAGR